ITGLGGVPPIGIGVDAIWENACAGRSGIGPITLFDVSKQKCRIGGEVKGFEPTRWIPAKHLKRMDDFARFAVASAVMAVDDAQLPITVENSQRIGVMLGNNNGGGGATFPPRTQYHRARTQPPPPLHTPPPPPHLPPRTTPA